MHLGAEGPSAQRTRNATERFLKKINRGNPVGFADAAFRRRSDARRRTRAARLARGRMARRQARALFARKSADVRSVQASRTDESRSRRLCDDRFGALGVARRIAADDASVARRAPAGFDEPRLDADRLVERAGFSEKRCDRRLYRRTGKKKATLRSLIPAVSAPALRWRVVPPRCRWASARVARRARS